MYVRAYVGSFFVRGLRDKKIKRNIYVLNDWERNIITKKMLLVLKKFPFGIIMGKREVKKYVA